MAELVEDFEDDSYNVSLSGTWFRTDASAHTGSWSLRSADIGGGQTTDAVVQVPAGAADLYYMRRLDTEGGFDQFYLLIDGVQQGQPAGGQQDWAEQGPWSVSGATEVTFRYVKDSSVDIGEDAAFIDDVRFVGENLDPGGGGSGGLNAQVMTVTQPASTGQQTYNLPAGFDPKALICWTVRRTADGGGQVQRAMFSQGFATFRGGAVQQRWMTAASFDNFDFQAISHHNTNALLKLPNDSSNVDDLSVSFVSFGSDSFTLNWTNLHSTAGVQVTCVLLGGDAVEDAMVTHFIKPDGVQAQDVTVAAGFGQPSAVFFMGPARGHFNLSGVVGPRVSTGFGRRTASGGAGGSLVTNWTQPFFDPADTPTMIHDSRPYQDTTLRWFELSADSAWPTDGFEVTWHASTGTSFPVDCLALRFSSAVTVEHGQSAAPTGGAPSTQALTSAGTPKLALLYACRTPTTDVFDSTSADSAMLGIGAVDGAAGQVFGGFSQDDDSSAGAAGRGSYWSTAEAIQYWTPASPTLTSEASAAVDGSDFELTWTDTDTTAFLFNWITFGETDDGGGGDPILISVDGASAATRASRPLLTQTSPTVVDGARSAVTAGSPTVAQAHPLAVDAARAETDAAQPTLAHESPLVVDRARSAARTSRPLLMQTHPPLQVDGVHSGTRADDPTLAQQTDLAVDDARAATRADVATLTQQHPPLQVDGARSESEAVAPTLAQQSTLTVDTARAATRADDATVAQTHPLTVDGPRSASRASSPLLEAALQLVVDNARADTRADDATLGQDTPTVVDGARSATRSSRPLLAQTHPLTVHAARADTQADAALLAQTHPLTVDGARSETSGSRPTLTLLGTLVVQHARSGSRATRPLLAQQHPALVVDAATTATRTGAPVLAHTTPLVAASARAETTAQDVTVAQSHPLTVAGPRSQTRATRPLVAGTGDLIVRSARAASKVSAPLLTQQHPPILVDNTRATSRSGTAALEQAQPLTISAARAQTRVSRPLLTAPGVLIVRHARAATAAARPLLAQRTSLAVQPARAETRAEQPTMAVAAALLVDSVRADTRTVLVAVDQVHLLTVAGARAPTRAEQVPMPGSYQPAPPPERTYTVLAEPRVYAVPAESRGFVVPAESRTLTA